MRLKQALVIEYRTFEPKVFRTHPINDGGVMYYIELHFPEAGEYIKGIKLALYQADTGKYTVYWPSTKNPEYLRDKTKREFVSHYECDKSYQKWHMVEECAIAAVEMSEGITITRKTENDD